MPLVRTFAFLAILLFCSVAASAQARVTIDPGRELGAIKPMNAANNGPTEAVFDSYKSLRIPYARTHDTPLGEAYGGHCIDINQVFPDFNAPVNSPRSYDFTNSDKVLLEMLEAGTKPFYRLGQSIEHQKRKYGIYPPRNYRKWARICEHIIRHYNEGWADGYRMGIEYWEIWNEPDLDQPDDRWKTDPRTWAGTMEQFDELYVVTAKHLKKCFPGLKIGGPAFANPRKYGPGFLDYVKEKGAPLDFFSHHMYHRKPSRITEDVGIIRKMLDEKGFTGTESILNEWNYNRGWDEASDYYGRRMRPTIKGAAFVAATMCACQSEPLDMLMYYDLRPNTMWCGPWSPFLYEVRPTWWALYYWAELADYGTCIASSCDTVNIYTCAARSSDGKVRLLVVRYHEDDSHNTPREVSLSLPDGWQVTGLRITDSQDQDRKSAPSVSIVMESNSIALVEIAYARSDGQTLPSLGSASGQSFLEDVHLSLDKGFEGVYAKGDTLKVYAEVAKDTPAVVKIYQNGYFKESREAFLPAGRSEIFRGAYSEATALMFRLADPANPKDSTTVGAIVAPEDFRPGFDEPKDWRRFWCKQVRRLRRQKMEVKLTPVAIPGKDSVDYVCYDLEVNCITARPVRGYLAMPRKAAPRSLPIAIKAHSAGLMTDSWTKATVPAAVKLAKSGSGAIALDINAHGILNGQDDAYYEAVGKELNGYSGWPVKDRESFYFNGMFLRLVRALDYLCSRKEWDRKRVLITGGSQGGAQSAALAGLDPRVKMVVVDVPAMWDVGGMLVGRTSAWNKPLEREGTDSPAAKVAPYYDAANFMRHYTGGLVVNVGLIDLTCPPADVWAVFNICPASTKIMNPCAWKGHSGKYSVPKAEQDKMRKLMGKYLDDAIDSYLR